MLSEWFSDRLKPISKLSALLALIRLTRVRLCYCGWIIVFTTIISGCAAIAVPSHLSVDNTLQLAQPLGQGETIVVDGINAKAPEPTENLYFIFQCRHFAFEGPQWDTIARLTDSIRVGNPAILATRGLSEELKSMLGVDQPQFGLDLELSDNFRARISMDQVRYLLFVKEQVETTIHVPLYFIPGGVAACGHKTILEAGIWEMSSGRFIGTLTTSAESEFVVLAWMFHLMFIPETRARAVEKLAQEINERMTGSVPDEKANP